MGPEKVVIIFFGHFQYGVWVIDFLFYKVFQRKFLYQHCCFLHKTCYLVKVSVELDDLFSNRYFEVLSEH